MISDSRKFYGRFIGQPISAQELFAHLPLTTRKKLLAIKKSEKVNTGETISKAGSFPENIYVLTEGKAEMTLQNELNQKKNTRLIEIEEFIGLTELISGSANEMDIVAISPCTLDVFKNRDFLNFLKDEPQVCFRLFEQLSLDIKSSYELFCSMFF